jgi:hypothetical protein
MAITRTERVLIVNQTSRIRDARFQSTIPALQYQIKAHFAPKWGIDAELLFTGRGQPLDQTATQRLFLRDTSDQAGDLGYHVNDGIPESFVFVEDDIRYGAEITVTMSHEIMEALGDPTTERLSPRMSDGYRYAMEACDPTEADADGETIIGIRVSNAVTPVYYGMPNADGSRDLDLYGNVTAPVPFVTPGGYLLRVDDAGSWSNTMAAYRDGSLSRRALNSIRNDYRRKQPAAMTGVSQGEEAPRPIELRMLINEAARRGLVLAKPVQV